MTNLDISKAIAPDSISDLILKQCHEEQTVGTCSYNKMFNRTGKVSLEQKRAVVIPLLKGGFQRTTKLQTNIINKKLHARWGWADCVYLDPKKVTDKVPQEKFL